MSEVERGILRQFVVDLKRDVIPSEVLPYLQLCLTDDDCEQILCEQDRKGSRAAVPILLERLKKRLHKGAFKQFSTALGEAGCSHLQTLLENALDQTRQPEPEPEHNNMTQDTTSNLQSNVLKTPTTETANPLNPSTPETKQSKKPTISKKSNKKLKLKNGRVPKENTTSPPGSKTCTKFKTADPLDSQSVHTTDANPPYVKLVKATRNTQPKKPGVSQRVPKCPPVATDNGDSRKEISSNNQADTQPPAITDPTPNSQPEETGLTENSKTQYDTLVCYAKENRQIALELKQFLETECGLQVCIDLENFIPGKPTADNISESINSSGSVIFLLSPEFLRKLWAPWELKHAVYDFIASQKDGKHKKIIPVLLKECKVPDELKIYTAIKMEGSGSRKDCWKKLAAAISGTSYSDDDGGDDDEDHGDDNGDGDDNDDGENNGDDGETDDGETNDDDGANNEGTIGVIHYHDSDDDVDNGDDSDDGVNDNGFDQEGGEDTVQGSNKAESHDDEDDSDNDHDGVDDVDVDKDGSENSTHDSDNDVDHNCDDAAAADGHNDDGAGDMVDSNQDSCQDDVSDDVDYNGDGNNAEVDGNNAEVDGNNVAVDGNASGDNGVGNSGNDKIVNNSDNKSKGAYGEIDSL